MELKWDLQENGRWHAIGQRKDDTEPKLMGLIIPPPYYPGNDKSWWWQFMDENIAGGGYDLEAIKKHMERMVVHQ